MKMAMLMMMSVSLLVSACGSHRAYEETGQGRFEGVVEVRWLEPDRFLFVPNKQNPLRFTMADGTRVIEPKAMYTDGGSIPRIFWSVPGYSPWWLAPAYIVHDWIFEAHHCDTAGYDDISFDDSSRIMAESIKTLMEKDAVPKDEALFFNVVAAVRTPIAEKIWDEGLCDPPPEEVAYGKTSSAQSVLTEMSEALRRRIQKVERDLRGISDIERRKKYADEAGRLRRELDDVEKRIAMVRKRPDDDPATILLYRIDMGDLD